MYLREDQAHAITGAAWLFGLAVLFYTGAWWPGVMFLVGVTAIIEGLVQGRGWYAFQAGAWLIGIGVWAHFNYQLWILFVILGFSVLVGAFFRPPMLQEEKPQVDNKLE